MVIIKEKDWETFKAHFEEFNYFNLEYPLIRLIKGLLKQVKEKEKKKERNIQDIKRKINYY